MLIKTIESEQTHIEMTDEDLSLVRRFALRELKAEEVWLGRQKLCNTRRDRSGETFPKAYLDRFAATGVGKSVMPAHDYGQLPLGRYYKFAVASAADHYQLDAWYYLNTKNEQLISDVELGILKDVSVGFNSGPRVCDLCGKEWQPYGKSPCPHKPLHEYEEGVCTLTYAQDGALKAEMMEGSFVWQGCQFDAQAVPKGLWTPSVDATGDFARRLFAMGWNGGEPPQENDMDHKEALAEVERLKGLTITSEREKALEAKLAEAEAKAALSADGEKYHAFIISDILRMADALDVANHDEEKRKRKQYEAILAAVKAAGAPALEAQREAIAVEFNARLSGGVGQAGDGNGNSGGNGGERSKGKTELLGRLAGGIL